MSPNMMLVLQSVGVTLQMINAGLSGIVHSPAASLVISATIGGYQYLIQHLGNQVDPIKTTVVTEKPSGKETTTVESTKAEG
jgi:hypothetical protein